MWSSTASMILSGSSASSSVSLFEHPLHPRGIELAAPLADDHGGHAVADQVRQRPRFRHEPVDAEDQRQAGDRHVADGGQRGREHDEAAAGDAGGAFRRQQQHREQRQLLRQRHRRVGRLGDEYRRHREVDRGAVEIERIAGRNDEADRRLLDAQVLHLGHHPRQHRFRRRRAEHDQELLLDVADEFEDGKAVPPRDEPQHDQDEDEAGGIERPHQLAERQQRPDAVLADGEGHRAERADRRHLHDDADDREQHVRGLLDDVEYQRARGRRTCAGRSRTARRSAAPAGSRPWRRRRRACWG